MASSSSTAADTLPTPPKCTADFCLIPMGTPSPSVSAQIADVQRLIKRSGVKYTMHSAGTTLEGPWDQVCSVIGQAHSLLHQQGIVRIQTDIRIGTRTDKVQSAADKVDAVNRLLAADTDGENTMSGQISTTTTGAAVQKSGIDNPEDVGAPLAS